MKKRRPPQSKPTPATIERGQWYLVGGRGVLRYVRTVNRFYTQTGDLMGGSVVATRTGRTERGRYKTRATVYDIWKFCRAAQRVFPGVDRWRMMR